MQITNKTEKQPDDINVNQIMCFIAKSATILPCLCRRALYFMINLL